MRIGNGVVDVNVESSEFPPFTKGQRLNFLSQQEVSRKRRKKKHGSCTERERERALDGIVDGAA